MSDFFISYNSVDEAKAEWIAFALRQVSFSVRFAKWELKAGESIEAWMGEALADSDRMIAVCSPDYYAAKAVHSKREREGFAWDTASGFKGPTINVVVRAVRIPTLYAPSMRIDLTGIDEADAKKRLIGALSVPGPPATPPEFTPEPAAPHFEPAPRGEETPAVMPNRSYFGWPGLIALIALIYMMWADQRADGRVLTDLQDALTSVWLPVLLLALYGAVYRAINHGLDKTGSRRKIAAALRLDRGGELYREIMGGVLDWIDAKVSWEQQAQGRPPEHWGIAWAPRLFEGCLLIAIFYPLYSVFAVWAVTNELGTIGGREIVPGGQELWTRAAAMGGLVGALGFGQLSKWRRAQGKVIEAHLYLGLTAAIATATAFAVAFATAPFATTAFAVALATAIAIATATAAFAAFATAAFATAAFATDAFAVVTATAAFATFTTAAFAAAALVRFIFFRERPMGRWGGRSLSEFIAVAAMSAALAEITRLAGLHSNRELIWLLPLLLGFFFWTAKSFDAVLEAGPRHLGRRGIFYGVYALALAYVLIQIATGAPDAAAKSLLLFLGFLPLLNAVFDFASIGLTRYCLRRGLRPGLLVSLKWSLIDVLAAVALFAGLVLSAISVVHYFRDANGAPLTGLNEIFTGIARAPDSYWWLYLTFFSTLIPTLLHLGIASFSFIALAPAPLQRRIAGWIGAMDRDGFANLGARTVLPLIVTLSIALPFLALYTLGLWLADYHGDVGRAFFRFALGFAEWLDAAYVAGVAEILNGQRG